MENKGGLKKKKITGITPKYVPFPIGVSVFYRSITREKWKLGGLNFSCFRSSRQAPLARVGTVTARRISFFDKLKIPQFR